MNVNCPGCQHSYRLDESRVPDRGQKMRCPKCSTSFRVFKDGAIGDVVQAEGLAPASRPSVMPKRPQRPSRQPKAAEPGPISSLPPVLGDSFDLGPSRPPSQKDSMDDPFGEIDLPAPSIGPADLPAPKRPMDDPFGEIDLPAPSIDPADLPAPKRPMDDPFGEMDLPAPIALPAGDIPAPSLEDPFGEMDLPAPSRVVDLPGKRRGGLDDFGEIDLPTPSNAVDLPTPARTVDLPTPARTVDLPTPARTVDLPTPAGTVDLPEPVAGVTDVLTPSFPPGGAFPGRQRIQGTGSTDYGEIDLGGDPSPDGQSVTGEFDEFPIAQAPRKAVSDAEIELAEGPRDSRAKGTFVDEAPAGERDGKGKDDRAGARFEGRRKLERQSRKTRLVILVILLLLGAGGAGLQMTPLGPFGVYAIADLLPNAGTQKLVDRVGAKVDKRVQEDTVQAIDEALAELRNALRDAPENEDLRLLGVYLYNWQQIRFGANEAHHKAATKLLGDINLDASESRFAGMALAALDLNALKIPKVVKDWGGKADNHANITAIVAEAHLFEAKHEAALEVTKKLAKKEKSARAAFLEIRCLIGLGMADAAEPKLTALIARSKEHMDAKLLLGQIVIERDPIDEARATELLESVAKSAAKIANESQRARAHALLGRLHLRQRRHAKARGEFDLAEALNPKDMVLLIGKGDLALESDDVTTASSIFVKARAESPGDLQVLLGLSDTMIRQGLTADAKALLQEVLPRNDANARAHFLMGKAEFALKNHDAAEKEFNKAIALAKDFIEPYIALSDLYLKTGRDPLAMRTLDEASSAVPGSPLVKLSIAEGHAARGDFGSAIVAIDAALTLDPNNLRAHFLMAQMYRRLGSSEDAQRALDEVASRNPNHPGLALEQGLLMEMTGKVDDALAAYERVLAANPDDLGAKIRVGAASILDGKLERAKQVLGEAVSADPRSAEANYYLGEAFRLQEQSTEAAIYLKAAKDLDESNPRYHLRYGMALMALRDMPGAMEEFDRAKELDPKLAEVHVRIGEVKLRTGSARDAIKALEFALDLDPKMSDAYGLIGEAFEELADIGAAAAYYQRATREIPTEGKMHFKLALAQMQLTGRNAPIALLAKAVELGEKRPVKPDWLLEAYFRLGVSQMDGGQRAAAVASFERYLEIAPEKALDRSEVMANLERLGVSSPR